MTATTRVAFMGTAAFAVPALHALVEADLAPLAVYTQPPRPAGRGHKPRRTPVHEAAERLGLPLRTPRTLRDPAIQAEFRTLGLDLALVAAYGLILPGAILAAPRRGCLNLHASLLPRWRGAAPIQRALQAGDRETGISIFQMDEGIDTGPVLAMQAVAIGERATAGELHDTLAALAARMVVPTLRAWLAGELAPRPQPEEGASYAAKIERAEGRIDWRLPALEIERGLRALNPWPGCWTEAGGLRLGVLQGEIGPHQDAPPGLVLDDRATVACGRGTLRLTRLQRPGRQALAADEFLRGFPLPAGTRLV